MISRRACMRLYVRDKSNDSILVVVLSSTQCERVGVWTKRCAGIVFVCSGGLEFSLLIIGNQFSRDLRVMSASQG